MTADARIDAATDVDLRIFTIDEAVEAVRRRYAEIDVGIATTPAVFREPGGHYWLAARSGWLRDDGAGSMGGPTSVLEGPADLSWPMPATHEPGQAEPALTDGPGMDRLVAEIARLRSDYSAGRQTSGELAASLGQAVVVDAEGQRWTIGYLSGASYRFAQGAWIASRPGPTEPAPVPVEASTGAPAGHDADQRPDVCPACGSAEVRKRFCGDCGAELAAGLGPGVVSSAPAGLVDYLEHGLGSIPERPVAPWTPPPLPDAGTPIAAPLSVPSTVPVGSPGSVAGARPPTAPTSAARSRPQGRGVVGMLSMISSLVSLVAGLGLLVGSVAGVGPFAAAVVSGGSGAGSGTGSGPGSSSGPGGVIAPSLTVVARSLGVAPPTVAVAAPTPVASVVSAASGPAGSLVFEDAFTSPGVWPAGGPGVTASYAADGYILSPHPTDDPSFIWAPNEAAVGKAVTVEASLRFPAGSVAAVGVAVADGADGTRLLLIVDASGGWAIGRDTADARDILASGNVGTLAADVDHVVTLTLDGSGSMSARMEGHDLGHVKGSLTVGLFGFVTWTQADDRIAVDHFRVTAP